MAKNNNNNNNGKRNKITLWSVLGFITLIWITVFSWLITQQGDLSAKVDDYQIEVRNYQSALSEIHTKLGQIETDLNWIKKYLTPYGYE